MKQSLDLRSTLNLQLRQRFSADAPQNSEVRPTPTPARSARECPEAFRRVRKSLNGTGYFQCFINIGLRGAMESSGVSGITGIDVSDNQMSDDIAVIITPATEIFILDDFIVAVTAV